jgi:hypothetical protein
MFFGTWAIVTAIACVVGFTYITWASFGEEEVK